MFADASHLQLLDQPEFYQTPPGQPSRDVRDTPASPGYTLGLRLLSGMGSVSALSRGRWMPGALSAMNIGPAGILDSALRPAGWEAQTRADRRWLDNALAQDDPPPRAFKFSAAQTRRLGLVQRAALAYAASSRGHFAVRTPHTKHSGARVKVSSPLEKAANVSFTSLIREALKEPPYTLPGSNMIDATVDAIRFRPESLGGPSPLKRFGMHAAQFGRDMLFKDNITLNASGVPIQKTREWLPGSLGKAVRLPLALGALLAVHEGYGAVQNWRNQRKGEDRFQQALNTLRTDPSFPEYGEVLNPETPEGQEAIEATRRGFDIVNQYAPAVAQDPKLTAQFLEVFVRGTEGRGLSPTEYSNFVRDAVALQGSISQNKSPQVGPLGTALGRLVEVR